MTMSYEEFGKLVAKEYRVYAQARKEVQNYTRKTRGNFNTTIALEKTDVHNEAYTRLFSVLEKVKEVQGD